jgi:hypothetical protein
MSWTLEQRLAYLLRLPWRVVAETTPEGDQLLRCVEIPSAVGEGDTPKQREQDFWESMRASLESYLHFGDTLPLPEGVNRPLPWEPGAADARKGARFVVAATPTSPPRIIEQEPPTASVVNTQVRDHIGADA